jgi:predicted  nucleic acid-binding Zn-ribbon protein
LSADKNLPDSDHEPLEQLGFGSSLFQSVSQIFLTDAYVDRLPAIASLESQLSSLNARIRIAQKKVTKAKKKLKRAKTTKNRKRLKLAKKKLNAAISQGNSLSSQLAGLKQI